MDNEGCAVAIRKAGDGWQVTLNKTRGLNKGLTILATTCGGMMGVRLAQAVAREAASSLLLQFYTVER